MLSKGIIGNDSNKDILVCPEPELLVIKSATNEDEKTNQEKSNRKKRKEKQPL